MVALMATAAFAGCAMGLHTGASVARTASPVPPTATSPADVSVSQLSGDFSLYGEAFHIRAGMGVGWVSSSLRAARTTDADGEFLRATGQSSGGGAISLTVATPFYLASGVGVTPYAYMLGAAGVTGLRPPGGVLDEVRQRFEVGVEVDAINLWPLSRGSGDWDKWLAKGAHGLTLSVAAVANLGTWHDADFTAWGVVFNIGWLIHHPLYSI